jgi:hypothetical protein
VTPELEKLQFEIPSSNYRAFEEYAERLAHTKKLRFISYKDLGLQFDNSMFFNQDHMNSKGLNATWPKVKEACFPTG